MIRDPLGRRLHAPVLGDPLPPLTRALPHRFVAHRPLDGRRQRRGFQSADIKNPRSEIDPFQHPAKNLLTYDLRKHDGGNAGAQDRGQGAATAVVNHANGSWKEPVVGDLLGPVDRAGRRSQRRDGRPTAHDQAALPRLPECLGDGLHQAARVEHNHRAHRDDYRRRAGGHERL